MSKYYYNLGTFFDEICNGHEHYPALRYSEMSWTYGDLNKAANQIVGCLLKRGIQAGGVVAIINTKRAESFAAMIACLKIGAAYTNVDRDNPLPRTEAIFKQCEPALVLMDDEMPSAFLEMVKGMNLRAEYLQAFMAEKNRPQSSELPMVTGARIAYIMFTSGSTGVPKGVAITHQNVMSFIAWSTKRFEIQASDVFANVSPMYFDNSVFDFYTALFSGASLAPMKKELMNQPKALVATVDALQCTVWFSVPSLLMYLMTMHALSKECFRQIRLISFGGEGYPKSELLKLYELYGERVKMINVYGPTEGTCICSSYDITSDSFEHTERLPSLGTINPNFDYLILNDEHKPDSEGELYILGPNIGLGYYRDPEKTRQSFSLCSDYGFYHTPMYKTGDLVVQKGALLYFKGRKDNQIKHMGFRIELEEIELAINSLAGINQVAVIYERVCDAYGKIIAFAAGDASVSQSDIKEQLKDKIPEYMIPNIIRFVPELPKNANGKIDKNALRQLLQH